MAQIPTLAEEKTNSLASSAKTITLRIPKFNPATDSEKTWMDFQIPYQNGLQFSM